MHEEHLDWSDLKGLLPVAVAEEKINPLWQAAAERIKEKILVLDDDPTGVQTVHGIPVYTAWDLVTLRRIFADQSRLVYILTNSRALTAEATEILHRGLAHDLRRAAEEAGREFILVSRGDSTLRGHFPLETQTLYDVLSADSTIDGEIIAPCFPEGGRITMGDIHYVREGEDLIPAGMTEFARDATFSYHSSNLKDWVEEKTGGRRQADQVVGIPLELLRAHDIQGIVDRLLPVRDFGKVILNAVDYADLKIFLIALVEAMAKGKRFLFRTAASFVQVMGGIKPKPFLTRAELGLSGGRTAPGLVIAGSHVKKTTAQLEGLRELPHLAWVEWDATRAITDRELLAESERVTGEVEKSFLSGMDVCVFTSRELLRPDAQAPSEKNLAFSARVSDGLVRVVKDLRIRPGFLVAKGGITASDIGVKGLGVKRAMVLGQIQPGVPVWELGPESRFPGIPYVIFPGNVGGEDTLRIVVEILRTKGGCP